MCWEPGWEPSHRRHSW